MLGGSKGSDRWPCRCFHCDCLRHCRALRSVQPYHCRGHVRRIPVSDGALQARHSDSFHSGICRHRLYQWHCRAHQLCRGSKTSFGMKIDKMPADFFGVLKALWQHIHTVNFYAIAWPLLLWSSSSSVKLHARPDEKQVGFRGKLTIIPARSWHWSSPA